MHCGGTLAHRISETLGIVFRIRKRARNPGGNFILREIFGIHRRLVDGLEPTAGSEGVLVLSVAQRAAQRDTGGIVDTTKMGIAMAKAMEELEQLEEKGEVKDGAEIGAVVICVSLDRPIEHEGLRRTASQIFVNAEPDEVYIQTGILHMALENWGSPEDE